MKYVLTHCVTYGQSLPKGGGVGFLMAAHKEDPRAQEKDLNQRLVEGLQIPAFGPARGAKHKASTGFEFHQYLDELGVLNGT